MIPTPSLRDNISVVASMMYGILMSVLAAVVPITETFASQSPSQMFEVRQIKDVHATEPLGTNLTRPLTFSWT